MYKGVKTTAVIVAAGSGKRMGGGINKQYINIAGKPVLARSVQCFENDARVDDIIIVVRAGEEEKCRREIVNAYGFAKVTDIIAGGAERQDSVRTAIELIKSRSWAAAFRQHSETEAAPDSVYVLIHDGARPLITEDLTGAVLEACSVSGAAIPAVPLKDTVKLIAVSDSGTVVKSTPDRGSLRAVQTPQAFRLDIINRAYDLCSPDTVVTDDASLVEAAGMTVSVVQGDETNIKITTPGDVSLAELFLKQRNESAGGIIQTNTSRFALNEHAYSAPAETLSDISSMISRIPRTGMGYDVHAFAENRKLILGGVDIPHERGLLGHSDADVLIHAVMDALLGAAALGDIGKHFPDSDPRYKGISSLLLLGHVADLLASNGWSIVNIDATVIAQRPKIAPHIPAMKKNMAKVLKISESQINIKGTTTERLGFTGREEGIAAQSAAVIIKL